MNKMLKKVCRVCGKYASIKKSLTLSENRKLLTHIKSLTGIWLESYACLPGLICECCHRELQAAVKFRMRCIGAQRELLDGLTQEQRTEITEEYEAVVLSAADPLPEENQAVKQNIEIIEEKVEFLKSEIIQEHEYMIESPTDKDASSLVDELDIEYEIEDKPELDDVLTDEEVERMPMVVEFAETYQYDSNDEEAVLDNVLDDEFEVTLPRIKKSPKQSKSIIKAEGRRRPHGKQAAFFCDQCGNTVTGRVAFELHLRRHSGDKQYQCEICQTRFCTNSELKRHMRRHTGERPFPCQYCGRCFTDYTTRVKHERTHTNERPYVCPTCNKAFTTGYILKNHMLVHSGERAHKCEPCGKTFILQSHLATHFRSAIHKRNLERHELQTDAKRQIQEMQGF